MSIPFPFLKEQFTLSILNGNVPSFILGLAILLAISLPTVKLYRRNTSNTFDSQRDKLINGKPLSLRSNNPNLGFGDIRVSRIYIHPIKSCRGTSVQSASYTPEGLVNDRKWCIIDADTNTVITAREMAKSVLITPTVIEDASDPFGGTLRVSFPAESDCEPFEIPLKPSQEILAKWRLLDNVKMFERRVDGYICESLTGRSPSDILSSYFGKSVHLLFKGPVRRTCDPTASFPELAAATDYPDGYPLLILSEESVAKVENELRGHVGKQGIDQRWKHDRLEIERFRPNIVFKGGEAFAEDWWEKIDIGSDSPGFLVVSKCARCLLPNVSPKTGIRDKAVPYKVMMKCRTGVDPQFKMKPCLGDNAVPLGIGIVRVGDAVSVQKIGMT